MEIEILENTQEFLDEVYGLMGSVNSNVTRGVLLENQTSWFRLPSPTLTPLDSLFASEPIGQFLHHTSDLWDFVGIEEAGK